MCISLMSSRIGKRHNTILTSCYYFMYHGCYEQALAGADGESYVRAHPAALGEAAAEGSRKEHFEHHQALQWIRRGGQSCSESFLYDGFLLFMQYIFIYIVDCHPIHSAARLSGLAHDAPPADPADRCHRQSMAHSCRARRSSR